MILVGIVLAVSLLGNAFFVAAELSAVAVERARIVRLAASGRRRAAWLAELLSSPVHLDRYVAACQVGITATSLVLGIYAQRSLAERLAGEPGGGSSPLWSAGVVSATVLLALTGLQLIFGELVPKAIALAQPERVVLATSLPMRLFVRLFQPFIAVLNGSANLLLALGGLRPADTQVRLHTPAELEMLIAETAEAGRLGALERRMLVRALRLSRRTARQVMISRPRVPMASVATPPARLLDQLAASAWRRIVVYEGSFDNIQGVVDVKDLLRLADSGAATVAGVVRSAPMVPEAMPVAQLWHVLQQAGAPLAVVLDEHGGSAGVVTREDLLEEITGEVRDAFDTEPAAIEPQPDGSVLVRGDLAVSDLNELLDIALPTSMADTVAGLIMARLGRLATPGDRVALAGVELEVRRVDRFWAALVAVRPLPPAPEA